MLVVASLTLAKAPPARAGCDIHAPVSGQTVTCDAGAPNPDSQPVAAVPGSTGVSLGILAGAEMAPTTSSAVNLGAQGHVDNRGTITMSADFFDAIDVDSASTVTNFGFIGTSGRGSEGVYSNGNDSTVINAAGATIVTTGAGTDAIFFLYGVSGNTVDNRGTVRTEGDGSVGMHAIGSRNTLVLSGVVQTLGANAYGLAVGLDGNRIELSATGQVNTRGPGADGLRAEGNANELRSAGTIDTLGAGADGMEALGDGNVLHNLGRIETQGFDADGNFVRGTGNQVVNEGVIQAHADQSNGLSVNGPRNSVRNLALGTITTQGDDASGIELRGDEGTVFNAGRITTGGARSHGIWVDGATLQVDNEGTIRVSGTDAHGVLLGGFANFTNLAAGSVRSAQSSAVLAEAGAQINNAGAIEGQLAGVDSSGGATEVVNSGRIDGATAPGVWLGDFDDHVDNRGDIHGAGPVLGGAPIALQLGSGSDRFEMRGGLVDGSVAQGDGAAQVLMAGGRIAGHVDLGAGDNRITITGGAIERGLATGGGADRLEWRDGGSVAGLVGLGAGDDEALLQHLGSAQLASVEVLSGAAGEDRLTLDGTEFGRASRLQQWERITLTGGARLVMDADLVLGDAGTRTGRLGIEAGSTLALDVAAGAGEAARAIALAAQAPQQVAVRPFVAGERVTLTNAGTIDLRDGASPGRHLTVVGSYVGAGGRLLLGTVLGADDSRSDRLVISGGSAAGSTQIGITNIGGAGALTQGNGIAVVRAVDGATTVPGAFSLAGIVAAGPYEYLLVRGGLGAGADNDWFLRSVAVSAPPPPSPAPPPIEATPPPPPAAPPAAPPAVPLPLYRPEAALYSTLPALARGLARLSAGSYYECQGGQELPRGDGTPAEGWARVFGERSRLGWTGTTSPGFEGTFSGVQAGLDVLDRRTATGARDRAGVFVADTHVRGDVRGLALGLTGVPVGEPSLSATGLGAYWTHIGAQRWYVDALLAQQWLGVEAQSPRGVGLRSHGDATVASLETGYPLALTGTLWLQPEAQFVWQRLSIAPARDPFAQVDFHTPQAWSARLGLRLVGAWRAGPVLWRPSLQLSWWRDAPITDGTDFSGTVLTTRSGRNALDVGAGLSAEASPRLSFYARVGYLRGSGSPPWRAVGANAGLRLVW